VFHDPLSIAAFCSTLKSELTFENIYLRPAASLLLPGGCVWDQGECVREEDVCMCEREGDVCE